MGLIFRLPRLQPSLSLPALAVAPDHIAEVYDTAIVHVGEPAVRLDHQHLALVPWWRR
jgi:hypothetical protein